MKLIPSDIGEYLSYDPETGKVVWIKKTFPTANQIVIGSEVGTVNSSGYKGFSFKKIPYKVHRVAYYLHYGEDPGDLDIDHINRDKTDNRIVNLRLVTRQQNNQNSSGLGVHKGDDGWVAAIRVHKTRHYIGHYPCPLLAGIDYLAVKSILHPKAHV